jgi:hypothetical protein
MKFAYLILVHQNADQFIRMVQKLESDDSLFFIHVDKKADDRSFKKVAEHIDPRKIVWLKRRSVVWAGFNSIRVTLDGLKAIAQAEAPIGYVTFISGQDYPIKPVTAYHEHLKQSNGASFMQYSPMPRAHWANGGLDRIHYYHILFPSIRFAFPLISYLKIKLPYTQHPKWNLLKKIVRFLPATKKFPRKFIHGYTPYEGSNWFTFSIALVKDILKELEKDRSFYTYFKYTHHSDEIFFQTLVLNKLPQQVKNIKNELVTYVDWDATTGRPVSFTLQHFEALKNSPLYFARKFDSRVSVEIMDKIDKELLNIKSSIQK